MTPIQMVAKFHDARDLIRRLYPTDWRTRLAPVIADVRKIMHAFGEDCVHAILRIGKQCMADGEMDRFTWYLAAAAEIAEPTP